MDIKIGRSTTEASIVPSHEGGLLVVDHGNYFGTRVYDEIPLSLTPAEHAAAVAGDKTAAARHVEADPVKPSVYRIAQGIGSVSVPVAGTDNMLRIPVSQFFEVMPAPPAA